MRNVEIAASYYRQAAERLHHARIALERGSYPYVVRQCQEAVELLLKAALRIVGVEPLAGTMSVPCSGRRHIGSPSGSASMCQFWPGTRVD
ncbi:MAG: HEPN domain-containing protein [Thermofilaceae archaeon]